MTTLKTVPGSKFFTVGDDSPAKQQVLRSLIDGQTPIPDALPDIARVDSRNLMRFDHVLVEGSRHTITRRSITGSWVEQTSIVKVEAEQAAAAADEAVVPLAATVKAHQSGPETEKVTRLADQVSVAQRTIAQLQQTEAKMVDGLKAAIDSGGDFGKIETKLANARAEQSVVGERLRLLQDALSDARTAADGALRAALAAKLVELQQQAEADYKAIAEQIPTVLKDFAEPIGKALVVCDRLADPRLLESFLGSSHA